MSANEAKALVCRVATQYANGTTPEFNSQVLQAVRIVQRLSTSNGKPQKRKARR